MEALRPPMPIEQKIYSPRRTRRITKFFYALRASNPIIFDIIKSSRKTTAALVAKQSSIWPFFVHLRVLRGLKEKD
jgi:hypothetical protein